MVDRSEAERAIASARSKPERIEFLGALLRRATGNETIVVGGSAVEILTAGQTASQDIDIVAPRAPAIEVALSWGFKRIGRVFRRRDWEMDIDFVGPQFTGSRSRVRRIETPYGPVDIAGPEDLIVKRLAELKHWPTTAAWRTDLVRQITLLLAEYGSQLDENYLSRTAKRDKVEDILGDFRAREGRSLGRQS